jgi:hypothetical protein
VRIIVVNRSAWLHFLCLVLALLTVANSCSLAAHFRRFWSDSSPMSSFSQVSQAVPTPGCDGGHETGDICSIGSVDWQTPDWASKLATAEVPDMFEALTSAIEGIRVADLVDDQELAQLRHVCVTCSAQEVILLSAALAAQPNNRSGQQEFLGILRTVANKPIPTASTAVAQMSR